MKLEDLSRIYDQPALDAEKVRLERVQDSRKRVTKRTLRQRLMDTENTGEAVEVAIEALQDESPEVVLTAVVEVLGEVVGDLTTEVADSLKIISGLKRSAGKTGGRKRKADAATCMKLRSKIKDSESTEEAKEIAKTALDEVDPESVVEVVIDVLAEVIDDLEGEIIEE